MEAPDLHHPRAMVSTYGRKLGAGDVLEAADLYPSSNGRWEPCPCPGLTLPAGPSIFVRPEPSVPE